jgi:hypothetical protein
MQKKELSSESRSLSESIPNYEEVVTNCEKCEALSQCNYDENIAVKEEDEDSDTESCEARFIEKWYGNGIASMRQSITSLRNSIRSSITVPTSTLLMSNNQNEDEDVGTIDGKSVVTTQGPTPTSQSLIDPSGIEKRENIFHSRTLHPYSIGRAVWDLFIVALFLLPLQLARQTPAITKFSSDVTQHVLNGSVKVVLLVDMLSNLITAYYDKQSLTLVTDQRSIAQRYLSGYIFCDALIVFLKCHNGFGPHFGALIVLGFVQLTRIIRA